MDTPIIIKGSFNQKEQENLLDTSKDLKLDQYKLAWKYLSEVSPSRVETWLERRLDPNGQVKPASSVIGDIKVPKGTAVVDCRAGKAANLIFLNFAVSLAKTCQETTTKKEIADSFLCRGKLNHNNGKHFEDGLKDLRKMGLLNHHPAHVVFYDDKGQAQAPEMALRYIDHLLSSKDVSVKSLINTQDIYFLDGGVSKYASDIPKSQHVKPVV